MVEELKSDSVDDATNVSSVGPLEVASGNANANGDSTPNRGPPQRPGLVSQDQLRH